MSDEGRVLSDLIAERVVKLRRDRGMTRERLAAACTKLGVKMSTAALGNIETGRRDEDGRRRRNVTADEWLTLALALEVTPAALLVDLESSEYGVPPAAEALPAEVLMWLWGDAPLPGHEMGPLTGPPVAVRNISHAWEAVRIGRMLNATRVENQPWQNRPDPAFDASLRFLRSEAAAAQERGVALPAEIIKYLEDHPDESP